MESSAMHARTSLPAATALVGAVYCLIAAFGALEPFCPTTGCAIFKTIQFLGISLWMWGGASLAVVALLWASGRTGAARSIMTGLLVFDAALLGYMVLGSPCLPCLVGGLFFAASFLLMARTGFTRWTGAAGILWLLTFWPNVLGLAPSLFGPVPFYGPADAPRRVFVSPSCPACRSLLDDLAAGGMNGTALFAVGESDRDIDRIAAAKLALAEGKTLAQALSEFRDVSPDAAAGFRTRFDDLRNKAALARLGVRRIPAQVIEGRPIPAFGASTNRTLSAPNATGPMTDIAPPPGEPFGGFAGCAPGAATDCPDPVKPR